MPIAMVFTLMPALLVVASLLGTLDGGAAFPVIAAIALLAASVIGLLRFMRTLEDDVATIAPGEHLHVVPAADDPTPSDADHDLPLAA